MLHDDITGKILKAFYKVVILSRIKKIYYGGIMRLHLKLSPNNQVIPFNYQTKLIGRFHKWLGNNNMHDDISLYSLSWLNGKTRIDEGLNFDNGANWFISFWDEKDAKKLVQGIQDDPSVCFDMRVEEIHIQQNPEFSRNERFILSSPVYIKKVNQDKKTVALTFKDKESGYYLTETLKTKMKRAGLDRDVRIYFDKTYHKPKTKLVTINNIKNIANFCPVILEGDSEAIQFAWNVGVGHSTGCGFGALC